MLKDLKISVRLSVGFGFVALLLIAIMAVGITGMGSMNEATRVIVQERVIKIARGTVLVQNTLDNERLLRNLVLVDNETELEKFRQTIQHHRDEMNDAVPVMERLVHSENGKKMVAAVTRALTALDAKYATLFELLKNDRKKAIEFQLNEFGPANAVLLKAVKDLSDHEFEDMEKAGKGAADDYFTARTLMLSVGGLALLLSVVLAFWLTTSICKPINEAVGSANKMAAGDFDFKLAVKSTNEVGVLADALRALHAAVQTMVADAKMLSRSAVEGKLSTRADATRHHGDFHAIVKGVNDTLDAVINPLNVAAGYVDRIAKGDTPPKITDAPREPREPSRHLSPRRMGRPSASRPMSPGTRTSPPIEGCRAPLGEVLFELGGGATTPRCLIEASPRAAQPYDVGAYVAAPEEAAFDTHFSSPTAPVARAASEAGPIADLPATAPPAAVEISGGRTAGVVEVGEEAGFTQTHLGSVRDARSSGAEREGRIIGDGLLGIAAHRSIAHRSIAHRSITCRRITRIDTLAATPRTPQQCSEEQHAHHVSR
jgi:CHASE3 domain sensor protein